MNQDTVTNEEIERLWCSMCDEVVQVEANSTLPDGWQVIQLPKIYEVDIEQWLLACPKCYECFQISCKVCDDV